jgi:hypothetical protein
MSVLALIPLYSVFDADRYRCRRELVAEIDFYRIWPLSTNDAGSPTRVHSEHATRPFTMTNCSICSRNEAHIEVQSHRYSLDSILEEDPTRCIKYYELSVTRK